MPISNLYRSYYEINAKNRLIESRGMNYAEEHRIFQAQLVFFILCTISNRANLYFVLCVDPKPEVHAHCQSQLDVTCDHIREAFTEII